MSLISSIAKSAICSLETTVSDEARSSSFVLKRVPDIVFAEKYPRVSETTSKGESATTSSVDLGWAGDGPELLAAAGATWARPVRETKIAAQDRAATETRRRRCGRWTEFMVQAKVGIAEANGRRSEVREV